MVLEVIFDLLFGVVLFILKLFPSMPDLSFLSDGLASILDIFYKINFFVDIRIVGCCLATMFIIHNTEIIWSGVMWIVHKLPCM